MYGTESHLGDTPVPHSRIFNDYKKEKTSFRSHLILWVTRMIVTEAKAYNIGASRKHRNDAGDSTLSDLYT